MAAAATTASTVVSSAVMRFQSSGRCHSKPSEKFLVNISSKNLSCSPMLLTRRKLAMHKTCITVRAGFSEDSGRPSSAGIFVGGFILGGIIVGTLGCVYAPQISRALAGTDRKDLMRKLPKFIYDEEKALEKTRKVLTEKIAQLNSAIDDVSSQLRADDDPNGTVVPPDELKADMAA